MLPPLMLPLPKTTSVAKEGTCNIANTMWSSFSENIKKRVGRYLLQRYLGQYLLEKLSLDQLNVNLGNGTGTVTDVCLDCHALNSAAEQRNIPIEFKDGHLDHISVLIPWYSLMNDSCEIEISGMQITVQSKKRVDNGASMLQSMWTSMASSMQLAEDYLKTTDSDEEKELASLECDNPMSGVEHCAQTIEAVLSRVKMCFRDSIVRVEQAHTGNGVGVAAEFYIRLWKYSDEGITDDRDDQKKYATAFSDKQITLEGIECFSDIYKSPEIVIPKDQFDINIISSEMSKDNLIRVAKFNGSHMVKLRIKKDESIGGPQISVDCKFGSLVAFLSPIQAHILLKLINELLNPESEFSVDDLVPQSQKEKPMDLFDFRRVEEEMEEQLKPGGIGLQGLQQQQGWSNLSLDESDEEFLPMQRIRTGNFNSVHSTLMNNSSMSFSSSIQQSLVESVGSTATSPTFYSTVASPKRSKEDMQLQPQEEKTQFALSFASTIIILLHEDILSLSSSTAVEPSTVDKMREYSESFFDRLDLFGAAVSGKKDMNVTREKLSSSCTLNHLRVIGAPLKIEGIMHVTDGIPVTGGHISLGYCEVVECLMPINLGLSSPIYIEVLNFVDNFRQTSSESIRVEFKYKSFRSRCPATKTTIKINLQPGSSELDISIISRISALLHTQLYSYTSAKLDSYESEKYTLTKSQSTVFLKVLSPSLSVNLRFPIPDCRAEVDMDRIPSWIRNVRNDSVVLQAKEFSFSTVLNSNSDMVELDFRCEEAQLYYKENEAETPILFAEACSFDSEGEGASLRSRGFDWPRVVVSLYPEKSEEPNMDKESSGEQDSLDSVIATSSKGPSVFSSRRIVYESLGSEGEENSNNNESVIPGDRDEIREFAEAASRDSIYNVDVNLRSLNVSLPSKHFFQEVYNRFCTDLLLWEEEPHQSSKKPTTKFRSFGPSNEFNVKLGDSESDEEEEISSFYTPNLAGKVPQKIGKHGSGGKGQSDVTVNLAINKGTCSFFTPFTNQGGSVVPEQRGQVTVKIEQGSICVVSGFKGNRNLGFVCLHTSRAEFYHTDLLNAEIDTPRFGKHLKRTIYPSDVGVLSKSTSESTNYNNSDMLAVAIKIDREPEKNIKTFKVAISIREGTLEHRVNLPNRSWLDQVIDFFDVTDTLVCGYTPSSVLTELHVHLWNCGIDYSPLNLPLRSILSVDTFSISSNIAAQTNTKVIRLISEGASLFISPKITSTDLRNDYVCVMDMDFFELSLRRSQNRNNESPRIELKASNNVLHIRTCSDSCKALFNIIMYYANYGDLMDPNEVVNNLISDDKLPTYSSVRESVSEPALIDTDEFGDKERRMSQSQTEHVNDLVAEAMLDSKAQAAGYDRFPKGGKSRGTVELKFEPTADIDTFRSSSSSKNYYDPIMQSADGLPVDINLSDDDEEFCILENDPGVGIVSKSGEPEARVLIDEPIRLMENYFAVPLGRTDILKAPKHYPMAVTRYSLQDISLVWHLYGGEDFGSSKNQKHYKSKSAAKCPSESESSLNDCTDSEASMNFYEQNEQIDIGIDVLNPGAVFSKTKAFERDALESPKSQRKYCGNKRRNDICVELHLNKIKFQYEVYPEHTEQASRQVLAINNVEIRDRLLSSEFNKMLYLYTSAAKPKQSHAHMIVVKAAHIRPDPQLGIEECCLKISLLPIRLNIDQDALLFLYQFYNDVSSKPETDDEEGIFKPPSHTPSVESLPIMTVNMGEGEGDEQNQNTDDIIDSSNLLLFEDVYVPEDNISTCSRDPSIDSTKPPGPIFFRQVIFSPDVPIRLDYRGKRVDMTHGPLAGILMGLAQLNCLEILLRKINHRHGILGLEKLWAFMIVELTNDIKKNQLPNLLGGVGPMYSFVQLFQGVRDLFWLPIEQYQKDGRITKGLQRGANAFSTSAAMAALELTNRLVQTIQGAAEFTYDMVSPGPSVQQQRRQSSYKKKRYAQPGDIREGMANAYHVVKEGLGDTAKTIVRVASMEHEQKGVSGAVGGVLRQIPPTVVRPVLLFAEATSNVLGGFKSQLQPECKKEAEEKWKDS